MINDHCYNGNHLQYKTVDAFIFFIHKISIIVHILIANVRLFMKQERIDQKKFHILYIYCLLCAQNDTNDLFYRL